MSTYTVWQLAAMAECADPDSETSPGADWLRMVAGDADDLDQDNRDEIGERADSRVPVYAAERWGIFCDLAAWREDPSDLCDGSDMTRAAGVCLYLIAERLLSAILDDREDEDDPADEVPAGPFTRTCVECGRVFDLTDETDAAELAYGHDCEA